MSTAEAPYQEPFTLTVVPDRDEVSVQTSGELDLASSDVLMREVRELQSAGFRRLIVDLRRLDFMDSSGLRALLSLQLDADRDGHTLCLVPGPSAVQRLFTITGTGTHFEWRTV